jgi:tetratricopeptide (TPR) repeat protein
MIEVLQNALLLQPDDRDSHFRLAFLYLQQNHYTQALLHMGKVRNLEEEKAFALFDAMAYAYIQIERPEDALKATERARQYAKDPSDILRLENRTEAIEYQIRAGESREAVASPEHALPLEEGAAETPRLTRTVRAEETDMARRTQWPEEGHPNRLRVEGTLETIECLGQTANLHIQTAGKLVVLAIVDPESVMVRGERTSLDFQCGAQGSEAIAVEYEASEDTDGRVAGVVRAIEYQ